MENILEELRTERENDTFKGLVHVDSCPVVLGLPVRVAKDTLVHTGIGHDVPGAMRVLESHTGGTSLDLHGRASVQGNRLDLLLGQDNQLVHLSVVDNFHVDNWHVIGKDLDLFSHDRLHMLAKYRLGRDHFEYLKVMHDCKH